jgi:hypothetical protein
MLSLLSIMTENTHPNSLQVARGDESTMNKPIRNTIVANETIGRGTTSKGSKKMVWSNEVRLQSFATSNYISIPYTQSHIYIHTVS